jgi:hypothetical protein
MPQIVVKVRPEFAAGLREGSPEAAELTKLASDLGLSLRELHPGATDPLLSSYLVADGDEALLLEAATAQLAANPNVEGAYVKPDDELPGSTGESATRPEASAFPRDELP